MCLPRGPATWCPSGGLCFSDCGAVARLPGRAGEGDTLGTPGWGGGLGAGELFSVAKGDELEANLKSYLQSNAIKEA